MKTMKNHTIILLLACFSFMQATAQDITTIHMKDGTSLSFENGRHNVTNIRFWEKPEGQRMTDTPNIQLNYVNNGYTALLSSWRIVTLPTTQSTLSVCVGTSSNLTLETCDCVIPGTEINHSLYFQIGAENNSLPVVNFPLQKGQTYYWRVVMRVPYLQDGQSQEAIFYDSQEYSFRIPLLMTESGLLPSGQCGKDVVYPDTTAWAAFYEKFFPDVAADKLASLGKLWAIWIADHQSEVTISQDLTFDDGALHLVSDVPDAFYQWMTTREVVINSLEQILDLTNGTQTMITDVDEKWQVPGNSFIQFASSTATANLTFTVDASEAVPGIPYMLEIVFAPDIVGENTKPTKLKIHGNHRDGTTETLGENQYEIPTTQVTRLALADPVTDLLSIAIQMSIIARETSRYQRVIRLAEVRLKPVIKN